MKKPDNRKNNSRPTLPDNEKKVRFGVYVKQKNLAEITKKFKPLIIKADIL